MPPRKPKVQQEVKETPIVFFFKINEEAEDTIVPVGEVIHYSDILNTVELNRPNERFNNELLKPILDKLSRDREYSDQTACFWCCHSFCWSPYVLPISYDAYKDVYSVEGHFCSPECGLAYLYAEPSISDGTRWNRHALLLHLYKSLYSDDKLLSPAPPRTLLRMFGGPLDIQQYREYLSGQNDIISNELPPIRVMMPSMNIQGPLRDIKKYVSLSNDVVEKASESLRLKRSKPVHVNTPTLDMCLKN